MVVDKCSDADDWWVYNYFIVYFVQTNYVIQNSTWDAIKPAARAVVFIYGNYAALRLM